ncbi:MAG: hypothetical protein GY777_02380 [Candidatus Brocadiaceae bacterium]|nr:hypothetical protein [Candidatus Brocadiaceae bacterium]
MKKTVYLSLRIGLFQGMSLFLFVFSFYCLDIIWPTLLTPFLSMAGLIGFLPLLFYLGYKTAKKCKLSILELLPAYMVISIIFSSYFLCFLFPAQGTDDNFGRYVTEMGLSVTEANWKIAFDSLIYFVFYCFVGPFISPGLLLFGGAGCSPWILGVLFGKNSH